MTSEHPGPQGPRTYGCLPRGHCKWMLCASLSSHHSARVPGSSPGSCSRKRLTGSPTSRLTGFPISAAPSRLHTHRLLLPLKRKQWKQTSPETVSVPSCAPITCLLHDGTPTGPLVLAVPIPPARQPRPHDHRSGHSWQELDVTQSADSSQCRLLSHNRLSSSWPGLTTTPHGTQHGPFAGDCCTSRSPGSVCLEARSSDHASLLGAHSLGFSAICTLTTPNFHI